MSNKLNRTILKYLIVFLLIFLMTFLYSYVSLANRIAVISIGIDYFFINWLTSVLSIAAIIIITAEIARIEFIYYERIFNNQ